MDQLGDRELMDLERHSATMGSKPALVVVDIINGFTDPACPLGSECRDVVTANVRLLGLFRSLGLPVYFTTVVYQSDDQARVFRNRVHALNLLTELVNGRGQTTAYTYDLAGKLIKKTDDLLNQHQARVDLVNKA